MDKKLHMTLIAGAIAALIGAPTWAAGDARGEAVERTETRQMGTPGAAEQGTPGSTGQMGAPSAADPTAATSNNPLYARTPDELEGAKVVDPAGDRIGSVKKIVLDPTNDSIFAVISVGGVLGVGADDIAVSLDELQMVEDDELRISSTKEQLEQRGDGDYSEDRYVELEQDVPISEFSAFESGGAGAGAAPTAPGTGAAPDTGTSGGMAPPAAPQ